jgi:hypothetical protein
MQRVTYINIRGESVVFAGEPPFILYSIRGTGPVETTFLTSRGVYQHGDTTQGFRKEPRYVELKIHIDGLDKAGMYQRRVQLSGILSTLKGFDPITKRRGRLIYENDFGRWWIWAIPESGPVFENKIAHFATDIPVTFKCDDPFWRTMGQSTVLMAYSGGGFHFPIKFPVSFGTRKFAVTAVNAGHVDAPVHVDIYGSGEMPQLVNHTTGQILQLSRLLAENEVLSIDTDPSSLTVTVTNTETGEVESAWGYLTADSELSAFSLRPGDNALEYVPSTGGARSRVEVAWYGRLEGV